MLKKLKSTLWFIYRWLIWIKDNIIDNPEINEKDVFTKHFYILKKLNKVYK